MASAGHLSPSSSPRLPSPPPMAEDQTGPQSPTPALSEEQGRLGTATTTTPLDQDASRRIRPGTKATDMNEGPPLIDLSDIDSPFQLTEHLKALHHHHTHPTPTTTSPITRESATILAQTPPSVDKPLWLYELCRFLVLKANTILVALFADSPPCSAATCPEMRASEWQYLCAVHDPPKSCCAIDYCCHTLDWAANALTSPRHFPSRLSLNLAENNRPDSVGANQTQQLRQLTNIFRRVYRIFAHAWFQHRDVFWRVEGRTGLYTLFKTVCDAYALIPEDNYTIPPEAEGLEATDAQTRSPQPERKLTQRPSSILRRSSDEDALAAAQKSMQAEDKQDPGPQVLVAPQATARRHKHSPSKGAPVATVVEENEEDESAGANSETASAATTIEVPLAVAEDAAMHTAPETEPQHTPTDDPNAIQAGELAPLPEDTHRASERQGKEAGEDAAPSASEQATESISLLADEDGKIADAVEGAKTTEAGEEGAVSHGSVPVAEPASDESKPG